MGKDINADIWNCILKEPREQYWKFREFPETTPTAKDKSKFSKHVSNYDLPQLYELERKLRHVILTLADYMFFMDREYEGCAKKVLDLIHDYNPAINEFLGQSEIVNQIHEIISNWDKYYKNEIFKTPQSLRRLACFQSYICQKIKSERVDDWRIKPEAYLKSFSDYCPYYGDEEALLYLISRGIDEYPLALSGVRNRWRKDFLNDFTIDCENPYRGFFLHVLAFKLTDWCVVDLPIRLGELVSEELDCLTLEDGILHSPVTLWGMLTTQNCISKSQPLLEKGLRAYQEALTAPLEKEDYSLFEKSSIGIDQMTNIAATYVFGYYRVPSAKLDRRLVEKAIIFLVKSQNDDGSFWHGQINPEWAISQAAEVIYALALSDMGPDICKDSVYSAIKWLKQQQNEYGIWISSADDNPVPLAVMVMDSIDLVERKVTTIRGLDETMPVIENAQPFTLDNAMKILEEMECQREATARQLATAFNLPERRVSSELSKAYDLPQYHDEDFRREVKNEDGKADRCYYVIDAVIPILRKMKRNQLKKTKKKH